MVLILILFYLTTINLSFPGIYLYPSYVMWLQCSVPIAIFGHLGKRWPTSGEDCASYSEGPPKLLDQESIRMQDGDVTTIVFRFGIEDIPQSPLLLILIMALQACLQKALLWLYTALIINSACSPPCTRSWCGYLLPSSHTWPSAPCFSRLYFGWFL